MNTIFHMVPLLLPLIAVLAAPGCGKGTATHSVTGVVTNISTSYSKEVTLTFKDGTEVKLKNGQKHAIFKNVPVRIDYDSGRCITAIVRLNPPDKDATVITDLRRQYLPRPPQDDPLNRPVEIQISQRPKGTWSVGSTMEEVSNLEGEPTLVTGHNPYVRWYYYNPEGLKDIHKQSFVKFNTKGRVIFYKLGEYEFKFKQFGHNMSHRFKKDN